MKKKKKIPKFKSEDKEREFWTSHDSTEFIDWRKAKRALPPKPQAVRENHLAQAARSDARQTQNARQQAGRALPVAHENLPRRKNPRGTQSWLMLAPEPVVTNLQELHTHDLVMILLGHY
jgi:hypothetical protein